jgi:hypothetical protein
VNVLRWRRRSASLRHLPFRAGPNRLPARTHRRRLE